VLYKSIGKVSKLYISEKPLQCKLEIESMETEEEKRQKKENSRKDNLKYQKVPEHAEVINFILKLESIWEYFRTCIIAECENCWIINGRIYKKEVEA
jgi:hypothetical protein